MKIELHMLQSFPPSCLNRDDTGMPKDCEFGGYRRARISSQCIKRAIRKDFHDHDRIDAVNLGVRTKLLVREVAKLLDEPQEDVAERVRLALNKIKGVKKKKPFVLKDNFDTDVLFFVGHATIRRFAESLDEPKQAAEALVESADIADLALFGRMLANAPKQNVDAACQVAHAISTNRVAMEFDYYTAVDDLKDKAGGDDTGAGMIGTIGYNSSCFYRYAVIDWKQLLHNLKGDAELARQSVQAFLDASTTAVPSGKQNTFAAHSRPSFVMSVVREKGVPVNLANAFLKPVRSNGKGDLASASAHALVDHWSDMNRMYGEDGITARPACWMPSDLSLEQLEDQRVERVSDLVSKVMDGLPGGA